MVVVLRRAGVAAQDPAEEDKSVAAKPPRGAVNTKATTPTEEQERRNWRQAKRSRRKGHRGKEAEGEDATAALSGRRRVLGQEDMVGGGRVLCFVMSEVDESSVRLRF